MNLHEAYQIPLASDEEKLELVTRCLVRDDFAEIFGEGAAEPNMRALETVLFDTIYPCPGGRR